MDGSEYVHPKVAHLTASDIRDMPMPEFASLRQYFIYNPVVEWRKARDRFAESGRDEDFQDMLSHILPGVEGYDARA